MKTIDEKYIDELISKVENITDLECYNDDIDLEADEIELYFGCEGELGILLSDEEPEKFSIFTCFSNRDFKRYEFEESLYEPEEIELEKRTFLEENLFRLILKKADFPYALTVTDDGNFMCPGYVSWIGFFNIPYSEKVIYDFNIFIKRFYQKICNLDDVQMMQEIIKLICKENDIDTNINDNTMFICNSCLEFNCEKPDFFECVEEKYFGQEYFLFKVDGKTFFTEVKPIELFTNYLFLFVKNAFCLMNLNIFITIIGYILNLMQ